MPIAFLRTLMAPALLAFYGLAAAQMLPADATTPPSVEPDSDTRFDSTIPSVIEVRRARTGHMLVHPLIDGQDLGWFIFDSGAGGMVIDKAAADKAAMRVLDETVQVIGIGGGGSFPLRRGKRFTLGPVSIDDLKYVELDLAGPSRMIGVPIAGIVGFDLMARAVVELDVARPAVSIHDPGHYRLTYGNWQSVRFVNNHPVVEARFEGDRAASFVLDTGSNDSVIFNASAVKRFGLLEGRQTRQGQGSGIAATVTNQRGVLGWFEFGGQRFEQVRVSFHTQPEAAIDESLAGNIGTRMFSRFVMVFDYTRQRMAFVEKTATADSRP